MELSLLNAKTSMRIAMQHLAWSMVLYIWFYGISIKNCMVYGLQTVWKNAEIFLCWEPRGY